MKKGLSARRFATSLLAIGALMMVMRASAENVPQTVQVLRVEGKARYSSDAGKTWQNVKKGDILQAGSVIQTQEKSLVDIVISDADKDVGVAKVSNTSSSAAPAGGGSGGGGSGYKPEEQKANIIRIFESTMLGIDKLSVERTGVDDVSETQLDLRAGQIMGNVKKLSSQSKYEIRIPGGIAGIRGTSYLISSSGRVDVLDGAVIVVNFAADGSMSRHLVPAGSSFDPGTGLVGKMTPEREQALRTILVELPPTAKAPPRIIQTDHTIIFISPLDGTAPH